MSAFERLPAAYRDRCKEYGRVMGSTSFRGGVPVVTPISPQNRRVRFAVDMSLAHERLGQ